MSQEINYQALSQELENLLADLEAGDNDVDQAIKKYQRGMAIVAQLQKHLKTAENKVKKVKASFADTP